MTESAPSDADNQEQEPHLVYCSVTGPKHEEANDPCQDASTGTQLPDSRFLLAVADGLGSASHSHIGSEVATETITQHLEEAISNQDELTERYLEDTIKNGFERARSAVHNRADELDEPVSKLNTTLLVAAGGPSGAAGAAVGDGGIIRAYRDNYYLLVSREDSEYANRTTPLQSDNWLDSYRFAYSRQVDGVAAFSDGLDNFAWDGRTSVQRALFEQLFNFVRYTTDPNRINTELESFLTHERFQKYSKDDKSIAIVTLDVDYNSEAPTADEQNSIEDRNETGQAHWEDDPSARDPRQKESVADTPTRNSKNDTRTTSVNSNLEKGADNLEADEFENTSIDASGIFSLTEYVGSDLTGTLYKTYSDKPLLVKILDRKHRTEYLKQKISAMIADPPASPGTVDKEVLFQWPERMIKSSDGTNILGYMFQSDTTVPEQTVLDISRSRTSYPSFKSKINDIFGIFGGSSNRETSTQYRTAIDLCYTLHALHRQDIAVGNLNHESIFATDERLSFSSCDQFHFSDDERYFGHDNVAARYRAPEGTGSTLTKTQLADRFALAIHVYQLLLVGRHPFDVDSDGRIHRERLKTHIEDGSTSGNLNRRDEAQAYTELPDALRDQFEMCFIDGFEHPEERPSPKEWVESLSSQLQ